MTKETPYHEGERLVQEKLGVADIAQMNGRVITDEIPAGALNFIAQQAMVILGSVDTQNHIWSSAVFGVPGFISAQDSHHINLDLSNTSASDTDPLWSNIQSDNRVGMIVIELGSRRRLRVNGRLFKTDEKRYQIIVDQAYPNCPQYIQRRHIKQSQPFDQANAKVANNGRLLSTEQQSLIASADTFFVSSAHPEQSVDTSHRGGKPGFVEVISEQRLRIPDYPGNSMFNTLGNFQVNPHAGLVFIDFLNRKLLQLTGLAKVLWKIENTDTQTAGTSRFWEFTVESWVESHIGFDIDWEYLDASPFNPEIANPLQKQELALKVESINQLSPHIRSFKLVSLDKQPLPAFEAGAHLQLKLNHPAADTPILRHYSILSSPSERAYYEIAVLHEPTGRGGSNYMHQQVQAGDTLLCSTPRNEFPMAKSARHNILIAGGIGITPILSMLQKLTSEKQSVELHYSARQASALVFIDRIKQLPGSHVNFYTSENPESKMDLSKLLSTPDNETHIYVCGPVGMINAVRELGEQYHWPSENIHYESFGTQSAKNDRNIDILLAQSCKTLSVPAGTSILDQLLEEGIEVPHQCKRGECGMCVTRVLNGEVDHQDICLDKDQREESMCICVSGASNGRLTLDL